MRGLEYEQLNTSTSIVQDNGMDFGEARLELPCDKFRSRFTFGIVTAFQYKWFVICWVCTFLSFVLCVTVSNETGSALLIMLYVYLQIFSIIFSIFVNTAIFLKFRMSQEDKMKFYSEIVNNRPYSNDKSWDVVCYNMISYFKESGLHNALYDGADCHSLFQWLLKDNKDGKIDIQTDTVEDASTLLAKDAIDKSKLIYLETAREKAYLIYLQSENSYWVKKYPELAQ
ncbi:similar to Naumovozyma castellii NCAS_0A10610 hypothetical protein [Maudiozyma saulgeensis]|uniref:Uncharacterized protein n=1 Tax=Maudiozyma saulgeensis TaxID=1789683 RepID=A0A1X7R1A9_9SACH|nr:similar to Naumovozyma castellii NCAS_0A10610 hypothetical protein [Kazachstania saulgeensis]